MCRQVAHTIAVLVILAATLSLAASCSRPVTIESFVKTADKVGGQYCFDVDMSDSTSTYDLTFYTRLDASLNRLKVQSIPMAVTWISPEGEFYRENVYLPLSGSGEDSFFSREIKVPYRQHLSPSEHGHWILKVALTERFDSDPAHTSGRNRPKAIIRGIGVISSRHPLK